MVCYQPAQLILLTAVTEGADHHSDTRVVVRVEDLLALGVGQSSPFGCRLLLVDDDRIAYSMGSAGEPEGKKDAVEGRDLVRSGPVAR